MKRSKLIIVITTFLGEISDFSYEDRKLEADKLLNFLEEMGMQPPAIRAFYGFEVNEWEKED